MNRRITKLASLVALIAVLVVTGCSTTGDVEGENESQKETIHITIGTASVGGVFYPIGMAAAKIWNRCVPGVKAVAIATAGSPQNIDMMRTGDLEVAVLRGLEGYRAINGLDIYKEPTPWLKALTGPLYTSGDQVLALKNKGIKSIYDFQGKRIAVGPLGSGGEVDAKTLLEAHGISYNDITPEYIEAAQAVDMMKDGLIDGAFLGLSLGASAISELMLTGNVIMLPIEDDVLEKMKGLRPGIHRMVIPAGLYPNQDYDVPISADPPMVLVCKEEMPEELIYQLTKAIYDNVEEMRSSAAVMANFKIEDAAQEMLIPYHLGTQKYFKDVGLFD